MAFKISKESLRVLDTLRNSGVVRGFELRRKANLIGSADLSKAVQPLLQANFIVASGSLDAQSIDSAQFAPLSQAFTSSNLIVED